jgi:hypothetical protein
VNVPVVVIFEPVNVIVLLDVLLVSKIKLSSVKVPLIVTPAAITRVEPVVIN